MDIAALGLTNTRVHPMDTGPQAASWADRCSPSSRGEGDDGPGRISPTSLGGNNGRVSPTSREGNNHGRGKVSPTALGGRKDRPGRISSTSRGGSEDGRGRATSTSEGVIGTGTENGLANRKSPENPEIVRNTNPRENTPESSPPVQADPLTCESIGSCDIIDMPNSDDPKKEIVGANGSLTGSETDPHNKDISIDLSAVTAAYKKKKQVTHHELLQSLSAPYRRADHPTEKSLLWSFICSLLFLVTALSVLCPVLAIVLVALPAAFIVRRCMACCCACSENRACAFCCSKLVGYSDAIWLHDSGLNRQILQSLLVLETGLDLVSIRNIINEKIVLPRRRRGRPRYPRFVRKIVPLYSGHAWEPDPAFNIENHIVSMPATIRTKEELQGYVGSLGSQPLPRDRPLWEIQVLTDFGDTKDTVVLLRIHPSLSDGWALMNMLINMLADSPVNFNAKPHFGKGAYLLNLMRAMIIGPIVFLQKWIFTRKDYNILHGALKLSGEKVVAWSEPFNLERAIRVKKVTRSTLHDILVTVSAGVVRQYMQWYGVQHPYDMLAIIPMDMRTSRRSGVTMGTHYCYSDFTLPTNTEGAIPRLWEIKHQMDEIRNSTDAVVLNVNQWLLHNMFPECLVDSIWNTIWNKSTLVISNMVGPEAKITISNREVKTMMYWAPPPAQLALSISYITYGDQLRMSVMADKNIVPNVDLLPELFTYEMNKLDELLANRRIPGEIHHRRMDPSLQEELAATDPSIEELQVKMHDVQMQLQELKTRLDTERAEVFTEDERALVERVENLKQEFRDLLIELRRRRAADILSDDEEDEDNELRRSHRRRSTSSTSRRSIVSLVSTTRPLTTPAHSSSYPSHSQSPTQHADPHSPLTSPLTVSHGASTPGAGVTTAATRRYHTFHHPPSMASSHARVQVTAHTFADPHAQAHAYTRPCTPSRMRGGSLDLVTELAQRDHAHSLPALSGADKSSTEPSQLIDQQRRLLSHEPELSRAAGDEEQL